VVRVGSKVRQFKPGDEIYARPRDGRVGTFAELISINEADVALEPKNLSMKEAASIPLVCLTVWQVLVELGAGGASRIRRNRILSQARTRRRLWPTAVSTALAASPSRPLRLSLPQTQNG
jgi:NADPH:quinone reductase-like Zn-dependent oxidoreductase